MKKEFVNYNQALKLKALGFDEPCFKCKVIGQEHLDYTPTDYDDFPEQKEKEVLIPTFSQAFRWFREKYNLHHCIMKMHDYFFDKTLRIHTETYEEAELACLDKLIEIVESKSE